MVDRDLIMAKIDLHKIFHVVQTEISDLEEYIKELIVNTASSQL